jgi:DNA-binding NarL/FixJ family response regulator
MGQTEKETPGDRTTSADRARPDHASSASVSDASKPIRVLLVDDDSSVADEIVGHFTRNALTVRVARTLAEARAFLRQSAARVDVVIFSLHLPDGRGESLLPDIEACARRPAVIITSAFLPDLQPGALEYRPVAVPKPVGTDALLRIVRTVVGGYARPVIHRFVKHFALSNREAEATVLLAQGLKAKQIAEHMCCSEKTVYAHLVRVCKKTGCHDYHEVVCTLLAFACHALGHTPPEHPAFVAPLPTPTS